MIYVILLQCVSTLVSANMEISSYCVGVADRSDITYWQILDYFYIRVSKACDKIRKNYCRNALNWPKIYIFAYTKTNTIILIEMCVLLPYSPFVNLLKTHRGGVFCSLSSSYARQSSNPKFSYFSTPPVTYSWRDVLVLSLPLNP